MAVEEKRAAEAVEKKRKLFLDGAMVRPVGFVQAALKFVGA